MAYLTYTLIRPWKGVKLGFLPLLVFCSFDHKFHLVTIYCDRDAVKVIIMFGVDFPQL